MAREPVEKHEPASTLIAAFGGLMAVSRITKASLVTVQRWTYDHARGTGGFIPRKHHAALIAAAKERGVELTPAIFVDLHAAELAALALGDTFHAKTESTEGAAA